MTAPQRTRPSRRGFTLVELIVVLMILVGLAAILIPAITDMVARTNASSASANITEISNAIQRYEAQFLDYPNNLDSIMSALNTSPTDLDTMTAQLDALVEDVTLATAVRAPLTAAGITSVGVHTAGDTTFDQATATPLADGDIIQALTVAAQQTLGLETTGVAGKYVVLGVGSLSDMNGKTMIDAPVYFPEDGTLNPEAVYARFIAVFQISDGVSPLDRARLAAILTPTGERLGDRLSDYFEVTTNN